METEDKSQDDMRIVVMGVGTGGGNTVNRLCKIGIRRAELTLCNTDVLDLKRMDSRMTKILIGGKITRGLGTSGNPETGLKAAESSRYDLKDYLEGTRLLILAAGLGGGTGTGSTPIIAKIGKEIGATTIVAATLPHKKDKKPAAKAKDGLTALMNIADNVILVDAEKVKERRPDIPQDKILELTDEITARTIKGIVENLKEPSLIKLDYTDMQKTLTYGKLSTIAIGDGEGKNKIKTGIKDMLDTVLLDADYKKAKGALIAVTGGPDLTIGEVNRIGKAITQKINKKTDVIWTAQTNPHFKNLVEIITIFAGITPKKPAQKKITNRKVKKKKPKKQSGKAKNALASLRKLFSKK